MSIEKRIKGKGYSFDDLLCIPQRSRILPSQTAVSSRLVMWYPPNKLPPVPDSSSDICLNIPIIASPMDTVCESRMAIMLAYLGGIGIIHCNLSIRDRAEKVRKVKNELTLIVNNPKTVTMNVTVSELMDLMDLNEIHGFLVVDGDGKLIGIVTSRDVEMVEDRDNTLVSEVMTKKDYLKYFRIGTSDRDEIRRKIQQTRTSKKILELLSKGRVEKLPFVDQNCRPVGMITRQDIKKRRQFPHAVKDKEGRLLVGGAVSVADNSLERAGDLIKAGADVLVVDSAHGHSKGVIRTCKAIRRKFPKIPLIAGNVATAKATRDLILEARVNAVKIGIGPGSICTTRIVAGVGVPQMTAIAECSEVARKFHIPTIADGGIKYSGDITKALAGGADTVMIGSLLAGTDESPGEVVEAGHKKYRGMGSEEAMKDGSKVRYGQGKVILPSKLVAEGILAKVPLRGPVKDVIFQLIGGLRHGMGYLGAKSISDLWKVSFVEVTEQGVKEGHPHSVIQAGPSRNYP